jgi:hypothetical protein
MPNTFELIASSTVGSGGAASIDFTSIPSTFTDLALYVSTRQSRSETTSNIKIEFNGSTSNLSCRYLQGFGSGAGSGSSGTAIFAKSPAASATSNTFGNGLIYIPNYAGSTNKSVSWDMVTETNATAAEAFLTAGLWANTAAITSIKLSSLSSDNFAQYSTAYLYGVKNA